MLSLSRHTLRAAAALIAALAIAGAASAQRRDRTTRRGLRPARTEAVRQVAADTVVPSPGMITLAGFAKPLRSGRESIFLTNRTMRRLTHVTIRLTYTDSQGRQLHSRSVDLACDVPPGETRQLTFASFDRQSTFYYRLNGKPRTADGTPFDVSTTAERALFNP